MKKELWFKRKLYGWGWYPSTWQGWLSTLAFILIAVAISFIPRKPTLQDYILTFVLPLIVLIGIYLFICYKKGESPRWQWGA